MSLTLAAVVLASAAAAPSSQGAAARASATCAGADVRPGDAATTQAAAAAVVCLINFERTARGLPALAPSRLLDRAASVHSADMVRQGYFAHVSPTGQDVRKRVARTGYLRGARRAKLGETIAWGSDYFSSPTQLVKELMQSPPHRAIITDRRFRDIGVGLTLGAPFEGMGSGVTLSLSFGRR